MIKKHQKSTAAEVIKKLKALGSRKNIDGMKRFGITGGTMLGVSVTTLRDFARTLPHDHQLANALWKSGYHEARILSSILDPIEKVTGAQMERMLPDFDSWDIVDQVCGNLFCIHVSAVSKAKEWTRRIAEYEKRAGFALMATLAWRRRDLPDKVFISFLPYLYRHATDDRKMVRKAINWALRQIGKRNTFLNKQAIFAAREIAKLNSIAARWIAADALRELQSPQVQKRFE